MIMTQNPETIQHLQSKLATYRQTHEALMTLIQQLGQQPVADNGVNNVDAELLHELTQLQTSSKVETPVNPITQRVLMKAHTEATETMTLLYDIHELIEQVAAPI